MWGYIYIYLHLQGQLVSVLPDTSWVQNDQKIFYLDKDTSLYSIRINGKEKRKITDNVDALSMSPDGSKVAVWNRLKSWTRKSPELWSDISVVDVNNGQRAVVENKANCSVPTWLPDGMRIVYELAGDRNGFCIFNIKNHEKKFVGTVERIADMTVNIAQRVLEIADLPLLKPLIDIPKLAENANVMVKTAIDAFVNRSEEMADTVLLLEKKSDLLRTQIMNELINDYMVKDGKTAPRAVALLLVARDLERISDHATNIAEDVIYMIKAKMVKHHLDS